MSIPLGELKLPFDSSELPLTMQELTQLIDQTLKDGFVYEKDGLIVDNWHAWLDDGEGFEEAFNFTKIYSPFYPQLSKYYENIIYEMEKEYLEEDDE